MRFWIRLMFFFTACFFIIPLPIQVSAQEHLSEEWLTLLLSEKYQSIITDFHTLDDLAKQERILMLIEALQNKEHWLVRQRAAEALGKLGNQAKIAIPALHKAARDRHGYVCCLAIWALGEMREEAKDSVPLLTQLLLSKDFMVPIKSAEALRKIGGEEAKTAIPTLIQTLQYYYPGARLEAAKTLGKLRAQEAIPALIERLQDTDVNVQETVIEVLGELKAQNAIPQLLPLLSVESLQTRLKVVNTLLQLGEVKEISPLILPLLKDSDFDFRFQIAILLSQKGWKSPELLSILIEALHAESAEKRQQSATTLGILKVTEAFEKLLQVAFDSNVEVQFQAIWALGELKNPDAIPALTEIAKTSPQFRIRQCAKNALRKLSQ